MDERQALIDSVVAFAEQTARYPLTICTIYDIIDIS